jgi:hypothetical protein
MEAAGIEPAQDFKRFAGERSPQGTPQVSRGKALGRVTYLSGNQVVVNVEELDLRRRHANLLDGRHDLLLGEPLELFS